MTEHDAGSAKCTIGIVCALHLEVAPLLEKLNPQRTQSGNGLKFFDCELNGTRLVVVEGGVGYRRATQATNALIDALSPSWILSVGLSGALVAEVSQGDLVVGNSMILSNNLDEISQTLNFPADAEKGWHVGRLCTTDHIVRTCDEKRELHDRTGAIAVDMESHAVATVCKSRDINFMGVRVISDDLTEDLPPEVLAIFGPNGTVRTGALVGTLFKRPSSVKDLWKLRESAVSASRKLAKFLIPILNQLNSSDD